MPSLAEVTELLKVLDKNNDQKVSVEELQEFLNSSKCTVDKAKVEAFIKHHDKDKDGKLNLNELAALLSE
ncbi:putative calcium-binding protein [Fasciola hepatica]|uniref:Calcium-binding protein n=1 Tax=Fasciola hepatica TaxID=6192 RepID=A0A2H1CVV7_FASHE|nr:putative calcium-binding protein [Fasciola hepatica]